MKVGSLDELKSATMRCRECPIGEFATQSVIGEGSLQARLMLVGEQPGDQEDVQGHPFVGPAGKLLARALEQAGIPRAQVFVSNAVKHFKFELRGRRRIHKSPSRRQTSHSGLDPAPMDAGRARNDSDAASGCFSSISSISK